MATELENVLLGDSNVEVVEKINKTITQTLNNADRIEEVSDAVESAGKINTIKLDAGHSGVPVTTYEPDANKVVTLPVYTSAKIDEMLGSVAAGMRYVGTLGTGGTITTLPTTPSTSGGEVLVRNGDTYKVVTAGTYAGVSAEVGDLFIASVQNASVTWTLVPSGDDGDVYANETLTNGYLVVGKGNKQVAPTKIPVNGAVTLRKVFSSQTDSSVTKGGTLVSDGTTKYFKWGYSPNVDVGGGNFAYYPIALLDNTGKEVVTQFEYSSSDNNIVFYLHPDITFPTNYVLLFTRAFTFADIR